MADNVTLQTTVATPPAGAVIATRVVTYSGDANANVAPVGLVAFSGADDAKVATDLTGDAANGLDVDVTRVGGNVTVVGTGTLAVQAAQSGTWTVQPGNTANTTAWKVDGSAVTQPVSAASLPLPAGAATAAKQPALGTAGTASTDVITIQGIASGTVVPANVSQIGGNAIQAGAGASSTGTQRVITATDSSIATLTTLTTLTGGGVAHDGADSGNPVKVGAKAITSLKTTTLVSSADRTDLQSDLDGALLTRPAMPLGDVLSERVSNTDGASTAFTNFSAVASTRNYITAITAFRTDAGTTVAYVDFRDGTAGSILWTVPLPPNGGSIEPASEVPYFRTSANTALAFDVSSALSTVYISVSGFQSKV